MQRKYKIRQAICGLALAVILGFVGWVSHPQSSSEGAACAMYSGTVIGVGYGTLSLWHGPFCNVTYIYASRYWTCSVGEYYNGYTCPENGGGGGGSW